MAMRPPILVLDEPTSQLDPSSAEEVLAILQHMNHEFGTTVIMIEHRLDRVLGISDELLIMSEAGKVDAAGPIRDVLSKLPTPPPLLQVATELGWDPTPLTVRQAKKFRLPTPHRDGSDHRQKRTVHSNGRPSIEFDNVSFSYQQDNVLDSLSTELHAGSVTALMGRNGSGKTTMLKLMNGLLRPSHGRIRVDGRDIAKSSTTDLAGTVGYLPQNAATLLFNDSIEEELRFTLRCRRQTADIEATLARFDISELAARSPLDLSGGERLRAALAAVLIGQIRVLLLDEPTRGVDAVLKRRLGRALRELADDGVTVVIATHDVDLVAEFADRAIILGSGDIVADGSPYDVMPDSMVFAPQINKVFGGSFLTVADVVRSYYPEQRASRAVISD